MSRPHTSLADKDASYAVSLINASVTCRGRVTTLVHTRPTCLMQSWDMEQFQAQQACESLIRVASTLLKPPMQAWTQATCMTWSHLCLSGVGGRKLSRSVRAYINFIGRDAKVRELAGSYGHAFPSIQVGFF